MAEGQWYWCLTHKAVEPYEACRAEVRLGPYSTKEEAGRALERVAERNESWDTDPRFNDPEDDEDDPVA
ncbi:MAG: SPOR domain-containing protein [Micropruina sp.]|nr:SPOR domain-containing protein [Micropruina sp.]